MLLLHWLRVRLAPAFFLIAGLVGVAAARAQAPVGGLPEDLIPSLRPILEAALTQSPQSIQARINEAQAEANRYVSYAGLWPLVSGSVQYATTDSEVSTLSSVKSDTSGVFYGFNVNQPLFQWGALKAQAEIGAIGVKVAERSYAEGYRTLVLTLRSQYLALISRKLALQHLRFQQERTAADLKVAEDRLASGTLSSGGMIAPRMAMTEIDLRVEQSEADLGYALRVFSRLAGVPDLPLASLPQAVPQPVAMVSTADGLLASFLQDQGGSSIQAEIYDLYVQQADLNYDIAKTRLYPKFSLYAGYSLNNSTSATLDSISQVGVASFNYGVIASWTIFDGFSARGSKLSALETKRTYELQRRNYTDATLESAQNIHRQLGFSLRALALAEQRYDLGRELVRGTEEDVRLGVSAQAALDNAQVIANNAELAAVAARTDYLTRWSEFVSLVGADPAMNNLPERYVRTQP